MTNINSWIGLANKNMLTRLIKKPNWFECQLHALNQEWQTDIKPPFHTFQFLLGWILGALAMYLIAYSIFA